MDQYSISSSVPASPPDNVTVMVLSSTEILVSWDMVPAIDQNGIITMYEVQYKPLETFGGQIQTETVNVAAPMMSVTLTNLQEFVNYDISVRAYTSAGEGPYSDEMSAMTQEDSKIKHCKHCQSKSTVLLHLHRPS